MKPEEAAVLVREMLADNGRRQFPFLNPTEEKATRALLSYFDAAVECIPKKCVNCGKRKGWDTCKEAAFVSDGEVCLNFQWRGPEPGGEERK